MTLSFSTKWPDRMQSCGGQPNYFIEKIWRSLAIKGEPISTFREYQSGFIEKFNGLWDISPGTHVSMPKLHTIRRGHRWKPGMKIHMVVNNRTDKRFQFAPVIQCVSVQDIQIKHTGYTPNHPLVMVHNGKHLMNPLDYHTIYRLAINDGFNGVNHFFEYFNEDFEGQIIHWTELRY